MHKFHKNNYKVEMLTGLTAKYFGLLNSSIILHFKHQYDHQLRS